MNDHENVLLIKDKRLVASYDNDGSSITVNLERVPGWSETNENFNKQSLVSIFHPTITAIVDGCQLNLSPSRYAGTNTSHINLYSRRATRRFTLGKSNLYANHLNFDESVTLMRDNSLSLLTSNHRLSREYQ